MLSSDRIQSLSKSCSCGFPHIYAKFCRTLLYRSTGVLIQLFTLWEYDEICTFEMFCKMSWKITNSDCDSNISTWNSANGNKMLMESFQHPCFHHSTVLQGLTSSDAYYFVVLFFLKNPPPNFQTIHLIWMGLSSLFKLIAGLNVSREGNGTSSYKIGFVIISMSYSGYGSSIRRNLEKCFKKF